MRRKNNKTTTFVLLTLLILYSRLTTGIGIPVGIGGIVTVNDIPTDGLTVTVTNKNTNLQTTYVTANGGYYAVALEAKNGDIVEATCNYNDIIYSNTATIDTSLKTNWLNLSITIPSEEESNNNDENQPSPPPSPPPSNNHVPTANFVYTPTNPNVNNTVTFHSTSTDEDNDITTYIWTINDEVLYGETVEYIFTNPGVYQIRLEVEDQQQNYNSKTRTIQVYPVNTTQPPPQQNTTDNTINNITLSIIVQDEQGNPLPNTKVTIQRNNQTTTVYTNETGVAVLTTPPGDYTIKTGEETKHLSFVNNGRVVFTLSNQPIPKQEGINWLIVLIPITIIGILITIGVIKLQKQKTWY